MRKLSAIVVRMAAALGFLVFIVTATPLVKWWGATLAGPWNDPNGDVLIVLGGSVEDDGNMGESSFRRSQYGAIVFREGKFRAMVLSGGGENGHSVAASMRDYLVCRGIPAEAIYVEAFSRDTRENALYVKKILLGLQGRKVLLTSDYHMARAYRAFRKEGIDVQPRPIPDAIKRGGAFRTRWSAFLDVGTETLALPYYFFRRWI